MTPGYQTSEFWLSLGTLIATITGVIYGVLPRVPATCVVGAIVVGYVISRGLLKRSFYEDTDNDIDVRGRSYNSQRLRRNPKS